MLCTYSWKRSAVLTFFEPTNFPPNQMSESIVRNAQISRIILQGLVLTNKFEQRADNCSHYYDNHLHHLNQSKH